jgi:hypothetical protein
MANNDLVKKKPVALEVATYERLSKLAAQLRIDNPGGRFVSMSAAVGVLLNTLEVLKKCEELNKAEKESPTESGSHVGLEVTYCVKHLDGKPTIYKVEEWEREGSTWEPINETL